MFPPKPSDIFSPEGGCSECLDAFIFFLNTCVKLTIVTHLSFSERIAMANLYLTVVVVVVVVFTLKAVPVSTQYFLTSVLVQLTRTPSVVTG